MKPLLDVVGNLSVDIITFLSSCTVISMAGYNVIASFTKRTTDFLESQIDWKLSSWLAIGSAFGGILGKYVYSNLYTFSNNPEIISVYQSWALLFSLLFALLYTLKKNTLIILQLRNPFFLILLGFFLGFLCSFIGIGGGPMNLAVLSFFLSMPTKKAAMNSLYMIFVSQMAGLFMIILKGNVPSFYDCKKQIIFWFLVLGMILSSIIGGIVGKKIYNIISSEVIDKLFLLLLIFIMLLCIGNIYNR